MTTCILPVANGQAELNSNIYECLDTKKLDLSKRCWHLTSPTIRVHVCLRAQVSVSHNTNGSAPVFTKYGFDHRQNDTTKMSPPKCHFGSVSARVVE